MVDELVIACALLGGLVAALSLGAWVGRRQSQRHEAPAGAQIGAIQGAMLGLLGLFLGFSFAGAASRFMERQDLIVREANAIGTAFLRADLLDEPHAGVLRRVLSEYVAHRLDVSRALASGSAIEAPDHDRFAEFHAAMWDAACVGVEAKPAVTLAIVGPMNEVIDLHTTRLAAGRKHLPVFVLGLLLACSGLAVAVIGFGSGVSGRGSMAMGVALCVVMAASLWATIDLDHPRAGLIRLSDAPLAELRLEPRAP
jgi:hypothetical protein